MTRILTINPGSTSTKIACFDDDVCLFTESAPLSREELQKSDDTDYQLRLRKESIIETLKKHKIDAAGIDVVVGRGGALVPLRGGVYQITDLVVKHAREEIGGIKHPSNYGVQLADEICREYNCAGYMVNPPTTDELQDVARITGVKGIYRQSRFHTLNVKEMAIRHAKSQGKAYEDCNYIVCHIGGGISITAHRKGSMIDGFAPVGEGPLSPTRCGELPIHDLLDYLQDGHSIKDVRNLCTKSGGFIDYFDTSDARAVWDLAQSGNRQAQLVWDAMIYQIGKAIGAMSVVLRGEVDGILLGGGLVFSKDLVRQITEMCSFIAPVSVYPGEFEMEAMAAGAMRVQRGQEEAKLYSGEPIWSGFGA